VVLCFACDPFALSMKMVFIAVLALILAATGAEAAIQRANRISPELEPTSDKAFFGKDYPADKRAVADKYYVFNHPYPAVQDSNDFDFDFVKDENSDGGRWAAQMEYDTLRSKIRAAKKKMDALKAKMDQEYEDWLRSKKEADHHDDTLDKARKAAQAARQAAEKAAKRVNDLEGGSQADGTKTGGSIGRAIVDVQKEMKDLDECKKALAKAKKHFKELLKQRADEDTKAKTAAKKEKGKETKAKQVADNAVHKKKEEEEAKPQGKKTGIEEGKIEQEKQEGKEKDTENTKTEVEVDTKKVSIGRKKYLKELKDVSRTEKQLEEAAKTLKKFRRHPYVDNDGGVYNVPSKSSARLRTPTVLAMAGFATVVAVCP